MILHKDIRPTGNANRGGHVLQYFTFTTTGNMNAGVDALLGPVILAATDDGKVARVGVAAPYDYYVLSNHIGPVWAKLAGSALQAAYDAGSTIVTDATGNAVKIKYANANTDHTALNVTLATVGTDLLASGNGLATFNYSPSVLRFGNVLRVIGANLKEAMMAFVKDSGARTLTVDPTGLTPGGTGSFSFTIQPSVPSTPGTAGIDVAVLGGESKPNGANGGIVALVGGQTGPGSTSGTGGAAIVQGGLGVGPGTLGGSVSINAGAADDGFASHGSILIGGAGTSSITLGNLTDNPSITSLHRIDINPQVTGANPNQYAQELALTGAGLQTVGIFLSEVTPEGTITANPGSTCHVRYPVANANDGIWIKKTGVGNTGWKQLVDSETLLQPASRNISGVSDTPTSADIGNVCHVSQAAGCTITIPDLHTFLASGREIILTFQAEGALTAMTFHCGAGGVTINGAGADYVAAPGRTRASLMTRDGLAYFTG